MKKILIVILLPMVMVACLYGGWLVLKNRTQDRVLAIIASAQSGRPISEVVGQFGEPSFRTDDVERKGSGGAQVNRAFCQGKTLYQYYVTPPCTWVNIYTDDEDLIVFVNWGTS